MQIIMSLFEMKLGGSPPSLSSKERCEQRSNAIALRCMPSPKVATQRKDVASFNRLQTTLAALPRARRQLVVQRFSTRLRLAFIRHIESSRPAPWPDAAGASSECAPARGRVGAGAGACGDAPPPRSVTIGRGSGCVSAVKVGCEVHYIARITIDRIAINSRCTSCLEEAQRLRTLLMQLRPPLEDPEACASFRERMRAMLAEDVTGVLGREGWSFRAVVDARVWVGRTLSSRRVGTFDEALVLRDCMAAARRESWAALRAAWALCMTRSRRGARARRRGTQVEHDSPNRLGAKRSFAELDSPKDHRLAALDKCHAATQLCRAARRWQRLAAASRSAAQAAQAAQRAARRAELRLLRAEQRASGLAARLERRLTVAPTPSRRRGPPRSRGGPALAL